MVQVMLQLGNSVDHRVLHPSGRKRKRSSVPFLNVWNCRFPAERSCRTVRMWSHQATTVTTWEMINPDVTTGRQMVDVRKAFAEYREAAPRRQESTSKEYFFDTNMPKRSYVQKRLSIYNWNPGSRRGKEGAIEKQTAGKWHNITLQEAIVWTMNSSQTGSMLLTTEVARCFSTRHLLP